ncbi:MAG: tRNA dihydrouridine synthase DusB [Clostridium sp.]|nr:tRNA dihydrouridine synthase DusB [Clostridium sp.]
MIKIGNKVLDNNVFLAPMAGITDIIYREIAIEKGCGLVYTEMVSAKALSYGNEKTKDLMKISKNEKPIAVQIFGNDKDVIAEIVSMLDENEDIFLIDINMGCPAPKLIKNGEGAALMLDPKKAGQIITEAKKRTSKPVTCKFRRGFKNGNETALEFAKQMESSGADLVTVHGRYRDQFYSGESDRKIIKNIKESLKIPVIANGDIFSGKDAINILKETNADGIMVARGAIGNPWIFEEIDASFKGIDYKGPTDNEKIELLIYHYNKAVDYYGEYRGVREMRKNVGWYLKGLDNNIRIKNMVNKVNQSEKVIKILKDYKSSFNESRSFDL